ncbi:MAG: EFR1 family ferrodoxin [Smithellaceae bacterium]
MKNTIIYFTGTGNSLAVSRLLAGKLGKTTIIPLTEILQRADFKLETDICGFVFPVCCQDIPEIVKRLVSAMRLPSSTYVYAVATHNGDVGYSHFTLDRIFRKKGQRLQAGFEVLMPGNSITPNNSTNSGEEIEHRFKAVPSLIDSIANNVLKRASLTYAGNDSFKKHFKGWRNMLRHRVIFKVPEKFWVTDACNQCSLCARICPENNIRVDGATVQWGKNCQMCLACIHWCPQHAIQNGEGTIKRKRYHHPDISIDDMLCRK